MTVVINGTTGITTPDITSDGGLTADGVSFASGAPANTLVTTSSGNVGIGTSSPSGAKVQIVGDNSALRVGDGTRDMYVDPDSGGIFLSNGAGQTGEGFYLAASGNTLRMYTSSTERARIDSSGNFQFNSGYGSVATAYGCRAWVNFNGTGTVAIRASGNVSSITDNGTGDYTVNFSSAMPNANYGTNVTASRATNAGYSCGQINDTTTPTTAAVRVFCYSGSAFDAAYMNVSIFR